MFFFGVLAFLFEHFFLLTTGASFFLLADLLLLPLLFAHFIKELLLEAFAKFTPCQETVELARALLLTLHFVACGDMLQIDTGMGFIDLLSPATASQNKFFDQVITGDAESLHPSFEFVTF